MIGSTLFASLIVIAALYFFMIRSIRWAILSYLLVLGIGLGFLKAGSAHLSIIGMEVISMGFFIVWCHYRWWRKPKAKLITKPVDKPVDKC